jgi:hypothetical protein
MGLSIPTLELSSRLALAVFYLYILVVFQLSTVLVIKHGDSKEFFPTC